MNNCLGLIKVGGVHYEVNEVDYVEIDGDRNFNGACWYTPLRIDMVKSLTPQKKKIVLAHELTHAILFEAGFKEQDEDMVDRISKILLQVIQDNDLKFILRSLDSEGEQK